MEVLQDTYKDTKIGRIPIDWEVVMLKDVCKVITSGFSFDVFEKSKIYDGVEVLFTKVSDMNLAGNERIITDSVNKGLFSNEFVSSNSVIKPNSLIFPKRGAAIKTNKKRINGKHIILDPNLIAVSFYDEGTVNYLFTYYYFVNFDLMKIVEDGTIPQINKRDIEPFKIPLPPLKEQQKIAAILSTVDEQISTTEKIIEKSKELKKGLMQKLFSEGIGHTEFKDTKIGRIPKDWNTLKINQVADCYGGTTPSTTVEEYWNGDILWATPSDITKNKSEYLLNTSRKITEQGRASKNLRFVKKNGLLMTSRASIGFLNISNGDVVTNQGFINIECKDNFHYKFFYYWVLDNRKKLLSLSQGSTFLELYRKTFSKISILTPPLPEQQKIADILSEVDAKIENEQAKKEQLEALKKGLMQQLLTGKKRVKV